MLKDSAEGYSPFLPLSLFIIVRKKRGENYSYLPSFLKKLKHVYKIYGKNTHTIKSF